MKLETCSGHPVEPFIDAMDIEHLIASLGAVHQDVSNPVYIAFDCPVGYASILNRLTYADMCLDRDARRLNYPWHLWGMFREENELSFHLWIPALEDPIPCRRHGYVWSPDKMAEDFKGLQGIAQEAMATWKLSASQEGQAG